MNLAKIVLAAAAGGALVLSSGVAVAKPVKAASSSQSVRAGTKVVKSEKGVGKGTAVGVLFGVTAIGVAIAVGGSTSP